MDSLPYVDTLFKEYLLFRGFTATLQSFAADLAVDRCCGFQAEALCELIFGQLLPQCRTTQLMELLELLADRLYSQLDGRFEGMVERMEVALIKAALVTCVRAGKQNKVSEFFRQYGDSLLSGSEAGVWRQWAALAFVPTPRKDPAFQAYFNPEWLSLLEVSFRNFLSQVMAALPLPAVLRFNVDRRQRLALQQQVESLQRQVEALGQQVLAAQAAAQTSQVQEQDQNPSDPGADAMIAKLGISNTPVTTGDQPALGAAVANVVVAPIAPSSANDRTVDLVDDTTSRSAAAVLPAQQLVAQGSESSQNASRHGVQPRPVSGDVVRKHELGPSVRALMRPQDVGTNAAGPPGAPAVALPQHHQLKAAGQLHNHHHGRTLSLEAWHSINAAELQAPGAVAVTETAARKEASGPRNADNGTLVGNGAAPAAEGPPGSPPGAGGQDRATPSAIPGATTSISTSIITTPSTAAPAALGSNDSGVDRGGLGGTATPAATPRAPAVSLSAALAEKEVQQLQRPGETTSAKRLAMAMAETPPAPSAGSLPPPPAASAGMSASPSMFGTVERAEGMLLQGGLEACNAEGPGTASATKVPVGSFGHREFREQEDAEEEENQEEAEDEEQEEGNEQDEEEDLAVMLVAGPAELGSHEVRRRSSRIRAAHATSGNDGNNDEEVEESFGSDDANHSGSDGFDVPTCGQEEEQEGDEEEARAVGEPASVPASSGSAAAGHVSVGAMMLAVPERRGALTMSPAAAVAVPGGGGGISGTNAPHLMHRTASASAAVVGGGRWQGVATYGAPPGTLHGRGGAVLAAQFSPGSGNHVATGASDGTVAIWAPGSGVGSGGSGSTVAQLSSSPREARLSCGAPITCVAWDARADKVMLVGTAGRGILAWHADTRRISAEIAPDPVAPWISQLACSRKDPVFIVAAATGPPPGSGAAAAGVAAAGCRSGAGSAPGPSGSGGSSTQCGLAHTQPAQQPQHPQQQTSASGTASAVGLAGSGSSSSGRLSLWNMRAFKRVSSYVVPQDSPVLSLAFNAQGSWFAAGTSCGAVHLYDSSSSGSRPQPLSTFRANAPPPGSSATAASATAAVQVYDSSSETVLVTCCGATVRLWSLRRLVDPLLSVPLLPYLPYGGAGGSRWSPDWAPAMCLSPRGAAAAVVLGGGSPAVYLVDLQGSGGGGSYSEDGGNAGAGWRGGLFGSPTTASTASNPALTAAGRVSVILPYCGDISGGIGGGSGSSSLDTTTAAAARGFDGGVRLRSAVAVHGGDSALRARVPRDCAEEEAVYGTSCSWHPTRDVVVVGYSDGAVQTVGLTRAAGG